MAYYDYIARGYNELFGEEQEKKARLISGLLDIKPNDKLLEVGSGTGIAQGFFKCFNVGIDPAIELLKQSKHNSVQAVAEHLPFKDKAFNIVISVTAIHNFKDTETGLREIKRVGKGRFVLTVIKSINRFKEIEALVEKIFDVKQRIEEDKDIIYVI